MVDILHNSYKISSCLTFKKCYCFYFRNNFLHVDIFYQDISYEEVNQNVAFGFLSLLSEVGGFLGLLLGASVLTVCELVDYMFLACMRKCQKDK